MDSTSFRRLTSRLPDPLLAAGLGALAAGIAAFAVAIWYQVSRSETDPAFAVLLVLGVIFTGGLVLRIIVAGLEVAFPALHKAIRHSNRGRQTMVVIATVLAFGLTCAMWMNHYFVAGAHLVSSALLTGSVILLGVSRLAFVRRRILQERGTALRRSWAWAAGASLAPALVVGLVMGGVSAALPKPSLLPTATQKLADAVGTDTLPTIPTTAPSGVAWSTRLTGNLDSVALAAGVRGPIVVTAKGVVGLDAADGSTLWSYQAPSDGVRTGLVHDGPSPVVTSPDLRHVAFRVDTADERFSSARARVVVVLDTMTGRVTAQRQSDPELEGIQLTDSAALIGTEVIALEGGRMIGSIPAEEVKDVYAGPAGHSTFILSGPQVDDRYRHNLILVPQSDLSARVTLNNVCSYGSEDVTVQDGWTAQCEGAPATEDNPVWTISAVTIDSIAATGGHQPIERISLGEGAGINAPASEASGSLTTQVQYEYRHDGGDSPGVAVSPVPVNPLSGTVFDPRTRTAAPVSQSGRVGTAIFQYTEPTDAGDRRDRDLRLIPTDGSTPVTLPVRDNGTESSTMVTDSGHVMGQGSVRDAFIPGSAWFPSVMTAPGCVAVVQVEEAGELGRDVRALTVHGLR
ncbi:hypothetical protein ACSL103130_01095 [Actinomyces slackii]|uniref:Uncharacterized protein n=1 Tax=Actinomyces slackii TaxID=52774 RepID=A0A3S4TBF9_9ACTO|nr:hypothetical protein [Actinomyces slackii]VEG74059.1 Uncharacterised protein [Actinomyces slackii]